MVKRCRNRSDLRGSGEKTPFALKYFAQNLLDYAKNREAQVFQLNGIMLGDSFVIVFKHKVLTNHQDKYIICNCAKQLET